LYHSPGHVYTTLGSTRCAYDLLLSCNNSAGSPVAPRAISGASSIAGWNAEPRCAPPRAADGHPDLGGVWHKLPGKYSNDIAAELKPADIQPWANELYRHNKENVATESPSMHCLPWGPRFATSFDSKIVQTPNVVMILQDDLSYRQIFVDGRKLPVDPNPSFMGYSIGRWDGDSLAVESIGFNDRTWLDGNGHPHSEALHLTERFHRTNVGHLDVELTIDDPKAYTKSWTVTIPMELMPDTEILEYVCGENEKDSFHMVGKASDPATAPKLTAEIAESYIGVYEMRESNQVSRARIIRTGTDLFFEAPKVPRHALTPLATDAFAEVPDGRLEFVRDASGAVTGFTILNPNRKITATRQK
jgi:hypothetical protein